MSGHDRSRRLVPRFAGLRQIWANPAFAAHRADRDTTSARHFAAVAQISRWLDGRLGTAAPATPLPLRLLSLEETDDPIQTAGGCRVAVGGARHPRDGAGSGAGAR